MGEGRLGHGWLKSTFPRIEGSRFVSNSNLLKMAGRPTGFDIVDELAGLHTNGTLPKKTVKAVKVYGPIRLVTGHGPNIGTAIVGELAGLCAELADPLHDDSSTSVPKNAVPPMMKLNGMDLNPAQVLRLMADAVVNPAPESSMRVRMTYTLAEVGTLFPKAREVGDSGFVWTIKPAPLNAAASN